MPSEPPLVPDLVYRVTPQRPLRLDLRLPQDVTAPPLILYIPMGGMRGCRKDNESLPVWIVEHGFALASIECRVTSEAIAPAQIHDCRAAVRWLRAHADEFGFSGDRIGAWGHSAGGHLAALLAMPGDHPDLEETGAEHSGVSCRIQAACDACGAPHDIAYFARPDVRERHAGVAENMDLYLGGPVPEHRDLARLISPATYISPQSAPILIIQGQSDRIVPPEESLQFFGRLIEAGVDATMRSLPGIGHGWDSALTRGDIASFFTRTLKPQVTNS